MKNFILYISLFFSIIGSAQMNGSFLTESARVELVNRSINGPYKVTENNTRGFWLDVDAAVGRFQANNTNGVWLSVHRNTVPIPHNDQTDAPTPNYVSDDMILSALSAVIKQDIPLSNLVATQILAMANEDDLDFSNGTTKTNVRYGTQIRWPDSELSISTGVFFYAGTYLGRVLEMWDEIKYLQTNLSAGEEARIDQWFLDYYNFQYGLVDAYAAARMGASWKDEIFVPIGTSFSTFYTNNDGTTGTPIWLPTNTPDNTYKITWGQNLFNNRVMGQVDYIHAYALTHNLTDGLKVGRAAFKFNLIYSTFSDGTWGEMYRTNAGNTSQGLVYARVSYMAAMFRIAHHEKVAKINGLASMAARTGNELFDYTTSDGATEGVVYGGLAYEGSSTTGGPKSLQLVGENYIKYYKEPVDGGHDPIRYFETVRIDPRIGDSNLLSAPLACINLYYNRQDFKDYVLWETSAGFPTKTLLSEGFQRGAFGMDYHDAMWMEMEPYWYAGANDGKIVKKKKFGSLITQF